MTPLPNDPLPAGAAAKRPIMSRPMTPRERRLSEDLHWAAQAAEVQQHVGKVVVVYNKRVVAVGDTRDQAFDQACAQEGLPWTEFAVEIVPRLGLDSDIPPDMDIPR
jgi:hypothetical protein